MGKLSLNSVKTFLSREEMRNVFGGDNSPKTLKNRYIEGAFMCCWDNHPNSCSACVSNAIESCITGAHLVAC